MKKISFEEFVQFLIELKKCELTSEHPTDAAKRILDFLIVDLDSSPMTDKQWQQYLAKEHRDVMWRALRDIRNAQASLQIADQQDLYEATNALAEQVELRLRELYKPEESKQ